MKQYFPTVEEALKCAETWEQSKSYSLMAAFRRVGVVLAQEVRRLQGEAANAKPTHIRIERCSQPSAWYATRIGQVLPVERFEKNMHPSQGIPEDVYWCREGGTYNCINYVCSSEVTKIQMKVLP